MSRLPRTSGGLGGGLTHRQRSTDGYVVVTLAGRFSVLELADAYGAWRESRLRAVDLASGIRPATATPADDPNQIIEPPNPTA